MSVAGFDDGTLFVEAAVACADNGVLRPDDPPNGEGEGRIAKDGGFMGGGRVWFCFGAEDQSRFERSSIATKKSISRNTNHRLGLRKKRSRDGNWRGDVIACPFYEIRNNSYNLAL